MSYRLALVEYLNTYPFSEGIKMTGFDENVEVHRVTPAMCAQLFEERKVDISLCPVGALRDMPDYEVCGKYCIGAIREVGTVVLLSQVPVDEIQRVRFDDQSRTSNVLLQILAKNYWKKEWTYHFNGDQLPESCLMIGDKVFQYKDQFAYSYDLAEAWIKMTGLPIVFAVWICKPGVPKEVINAIDVAFETGMNVVKNGRTHLEDWQKDYLLKSISYPLDEDKMKGMKLFQEMSAVIEKGEG